MKLSSIRPNPANPRTIQAGKMDALVRSLLVFPKMLKLREIVVAGKKGKPISQGGNMRLKAIHRIVEMPWEEIEAAQQEITGQDERIKANLEFWKEVRETKSLPDWCVKYAEDFSASELKEFIIKDNVGFGEWDWDMLANEWDAGELAEWGVDVPEWENIDYSNANKELGIDDLGEKMTIKLEYVFEEYEAVRAALSKIAPTPEQAVWELLDLKAIENE